MKLVPFGGPTNCVSLHRRRGRLSTLNDDIEVRMNRAYTALIERDGDWLVAYCPEVPGANGQGRTMQEAAANLREAVVLILDAKSRGPSKSGNLNGTSVK
jgi:predicted RNase H-like HicB family nuclease